LENEYSFHWQGKGYELRINTAPHHRDIETFPRHIHKNRRVEEDKITGLSLSPGDNFRRVLNYIRNELAKKMNKDSQRLK